MINTMWKNPVGLVFMEEEVNNVGGNDRLNLGTIQDDFNLPRD